MKKLLIKILAKIAGKKLNEEASEWSDVSKTKVIAVLAVVAIAVEKLSIAWGHPIQIPPEILEILAGAGLYTLRDAIKS